MENSTERAKSNQSKNNNTSGRFRRQNFSVKETFILLKLLKEVQLKSKKSDKARNFLPEDWKEIYPKYNEKCNGTKRSEYELHARYKTVKKNFYIYKELVDRNEWAWNYDDHLPVSPSREAWQEVLKENKKYKGYQKRTFPWYKAMEDLCGKNTDSNANNMNFDLEIENEFDNSDNNSREANEEELEGFQLNLTPQQEFEQDRNNCDYNINPPNDNIIPPVNIQESQIEQLNGNQSQNEPQIETRAAKKRRVDALNGESSNNKRKTQSKVMDNENFIQKIIEQTDRFIEIQKERTSIFSKLVVNKPDPNEVCREVIRRLNSNGINLGPNELTTLIVTLSNPWIRGVFMNIEGNQLKDWINNMLVPSNLITRRMMTMDMESDIRSNEDDARFIAEMMDDDNMYVHLRNTNMMMLSLMSSFPNCLGNNKSRRRSRRN